MAILAPVPVPPQNNGLMSLSPRFQQQPGSMVDTQSDTYLPDGMLGQGIAGLKQAIEKVASAFTAPGGEALIGGPAMVRPFFHGTTERAAESILKNGFDISKFGTGADSAKSVFSNPTGWFGKGHYVAQKPENAAWYAEQRSGMTGEMPSVLKADIDDAHLLNLSTAESRRSAIEAYAKDRGLNSNGIASESLAQLTDRQLAPYMTEYAQRVGKKGVMWPAESVIFDPSAVQKIERYK